MNGDRGSGHRLDDATIEGLNEVVNANAELAAASFMRRLAANGGPQLSHKELELLVATFKVYVAATLAQLGDGGGNAA